MTPENTCVSCKPMFTLDCCDIDGTGDYVCTCKPIFTLVWCDIDGTGEYMCIM